MTPVEQIASACVEELKGAKRGAAAGGAPCTWTEVGLMIGKACEKAFAAGKVAGQKERKKSAPLAEGCEQVFNAYPRRVGGKDALISISKAILADGLETVLEGTLEFSAAVARWPKARLTSKSGTSFIPLPTTFYGNQRYKLDDRRTWWEGTGKAEKDEKQALALAEPQGWRFAHPESRFVTENIAWANIDVASQRWIIANTPQQRQA